MGIQNITKVFQMKWQRVVTIYAIFIAVAIIGIYLGGFVFAGSKISYRWDSTPIIRDTSVLEVSELIYFLDDHSFTGNACSEELINRSSPELIEELKRELESIEASEGIYSNRYVRLCGTLMVMGDDKETRFDTLLSMMKEDPYGRGYLIPYYFRQLDPVDDYPLIEQVINIETTENPESGQTEFLAERYKADILKGFPSIDVAREYLLGNITDDDGNYYDDKFLREMGSEIYSITAKLYDFGDMAQYDQAFVGDPRLLEPIMHYVNSEFEACWRPGLNALSHHYGYEEVRNFLHDTLENHPDKSHRREALWAIMSTVSNDEKIEMIKTVLEKNEAYEVKFAAILWAGLLREDGLELVPLLQKQINLRNAFTFKGRTLIARAGDAIEQITGSEPDRPPGTRHYIHDSITPIYVPLSERGPDGDEFE